MARHSINFTTTKSKLNFIYTCYGQVFVRPVNQCRLALNSITLSCRVKVINCPWLTTELSTNSSKILCICALFWARHP